MWIESQSESLKELAPKGVDWSDRAQFSNGTAQVKHEVGRILIENYDEISKKDDGKDKQEEDSQDSNI